MNYRNLLLMLTLFSVTPDALAQGDAETGKTTAYTCTGCHGIPGYNNTYPTYKVPKLGGQNAGYVVSALQSYASEARSHATMQLHSQGLSEQEMTDIAAWLSSFELEPVSGAADAAMPESAQLCVSCHGTDGRGTDPSYPILSGQHENYLVRALRDYRDGGRQNAIMGGFASQLSDQDIDEIAAWYASMPGLRDLSER